MEYMEWVIQQIELFYNTKLESNFAKNIINKTMKHLEQFYPPKGRFFLIMYDNQLAGTGCLRNNKKGIGEIKRMYIRPKMRGMGLGKKTLEKLITEAKIIGYSKLRLDTGPFMKEAQSLYRSYGFKEIDIYPETEVPEEFRSKWSFLEKKLDIKK